MSPLKFLLTNQIKGSGETTKVGGFTLIELLVAIILAALVIGPLLGFMINVMDADRKEQAKSNTEQDIKAALDYMTRDLEQAVYIYDADGIAQIKNQLPASNTDSARFPVLVFWKRQYLKDKIPTTKTTSDCVTQPDTCDDTFVYSLVGYYLVKDKNTVANNTWSKAARIARFQISNGYGSTTADIEATRDKPFKMFDVNLAGTLKDRMNAWTRSTTGDITLDTLVDHIDQTTFAHNPPACPTVANPADPSLPIQMQQVPNYTAGGASSVTDAELRTGSFYVCVDSANTVADIRIRGNSLARIRPSNPPTYQNESPYFPKTSVRVQGRGFLFTQ